MADHVFPASLSVTHVHCLSRCVSHHPFGSEMKLRLATLGLMLLLWVAPAFSQGCAMCYSNATGTTKEGQRAISRGVLVLPRRSQSSSTSFLDPHPASYRTGRPYRHPESCIQLEESAKPAPPRE